MKDREMINMFFKRDEKAIDEMIKKYHSYCMKIANNILCNQEDAKECVNESYMNVWNSIPPNKPRILSSYVAKIVRNNAFNIYKKNKAIKRGYNQMDIVLDELYEMIEGNESVYESFDYSLLVENINKFLSLQSKDKRIIFVRRYFYADSIKDIANQLNKSENSVSVILNRLRKELRNYLLERGYTL